MERGNFLENDRDDEKLVELDEDKFSVVDGQMRYQIKNFKLFIEIDLPSDLKSVKSEKNLSSTGKTYRIYSNGTNRRFIKEGPYEFAQIQINSYISVKDYEKL